MSLNRSLLLPYEECGAEAAQGSSHSASLHQPKRPTTTDTTETTYQPAHQTAEDAVLKLRH